MFIINPPQTPPGRLYTIPAVVFMLLELPRTSRPLFPQEADQLQSGMAAYGSLSFEEVVQELIKQKEVVKKKDAHIRELEDYIDNLLVRVMEETPSILRTPYEPKRKAGKISKK